MASTVFLEGLRGIVAGEIDLNGDDIRAILCMSNTSAATDANTATALTIDTIITLDETDDSGGPDRQALATEAVDVDDVNNRVEFSESGSAIVFGSGNTFSGDATRDYTGIVLYKHVTDDTDSIPIAWIEFPSSIDKASTQITVNWSTQGIIQFASA